MKILAIETSCDETAAAVVEDGQMVLGSSIASSLELHKQTGGVVPEVAAREHPLKIWPVIEDALAQAGLKIEEIDAIAATSGPGLLPALLTGYLTGKTIAHLLNKKFIPVHHILGHIYANFLDRNPTEIKFPIVVLTVSGGHNQLVLLRDHFDFEIIGQTRDDSAGEAFDKVARLLGLGYPGGPEISRQASASKYCENPAQNPVKLPYPWVNETNLKTRWDKRNFDFSFSGLKSAVKREVESHQKIDAEFVCDCSASFQDSATEILATKLVGAGEQYQAQEIHIAGGVSANTYLRKKIEIKCANKFTFRFPEKFLYCTDNACMIGAVAYYQDKCNLVPDIRDVDPNLSLDLFKKN